MNYSKLSAEAVLNTNFFGQVKDLRSVDGIGYATTKRANLGLRSSDGRPSDLSVKTLTAEEVAKACPDYKGQAHSLEPFSSEGSEVLDNNKKGNTKNEQYNNYD